MVRVRFLALRSVSPVAGNRYCCDIAAMLTRFYVEALLVDEDLADQVWEAWDKGEIDDQVAWLAWWLLAIKYQDADTMTDEQIDQEPKQLLAQSGLALVPIT